MAKRMAQKEIYVKAKNFQGPSLAQAPHLQNPLPKNSEILAIWSHGHMFLKIFKNRCFCILRAPKSI